MNIGGIEVNTRLVLAPMAGTGDISFRSICRSMGAGMTVTEMVSAKALCYGDKKTKSLLLLAADEHPASAQIFGSDKVCMGEAAQMAAEISGADFIDINMGCPVGKVVKSGDGSALMKNPEHARNIIEAVVKNAGRPVTVKFRKGWDSGSINAVEFAVMCQEAGASAIAVHGRTRAQMYSGRADWDIIKAVKNAVSIPVMANGDVFEPQDAIHILNYTGADAAMIGRGSFGNPWIFARAAALLEGASLPPEPSVRMRMDTAVHQIELAAEYHGERQACIEARKHLAWYLKGVRNAAFYRDMLVRVSTLEEVRAIAQEIKENLR